MLEKAGGAPRLDSFLVREIRNKHATGKYTYKELGHEYVIHPNTVRHLVKRRTWKDVK
jgi:uncharacterized protein YjcR